MNIRIVALGGNSESAIAAFNGDLTGLRDYLQDSDIRTGVPLSYVVRNVVDNRTVNVKVATDYDLKWGDYAPFRYQGPYIWAKDEGTGGTWFFRTADRYHGDMSYMFDGLMSFALNAGYGPNGDPRENGPRVAVGDDILISGGTRTIAYRIPQAEWPVAENYRLYQIGLGADDGWKLVLSPDYYAPASERPAATEEEILSVLRNVTAIRIRGEWFNGLDWCAIDEFRMESPLVPEE